MVRTEPLHNPPSESGQCWTGFQRKGRLLGTRFGLELLEYVVQPVLMWRGYRQKLYADAGGPGPADCGIVYQDGL
jgi:hypothetical protein